MKRLLTSAAAAAVLVAGSGSGAQAQEAGASLFDLSIYGGIGYHYNWLDSDISQVGIDGPMNPGFAPVVGAAATFWATPALGFRTNVTFSDIDLPQNSNPEVVNGWFYDLNLMLRPFIARSTGPRLMNTFYLFLGGGGFTANPPGSGLGCVTPYATLAGACLPLDWEKATVGQGTAGFGWDVISLTDNIGLFTELAGNVYDSPFHTGPAWAPQPAGIDSEEFDTYGFTGRLTAGLKFSLGERAPVIVPAPLPPPPPPPAPAAPPAPATRDITVCVVTPTGLQNVTATFNPATGDTMVTGQRFSQRYPTTAPTYGAGASWFINTDALSFNNTDYVKYGVSRLITDVSQLTRVGEFQGTPVFAEAGATTPYAFVYVPLRPGCEFQPYRPREQLRPRG